MQTLKGLLQKADEEARDPYLALLEYRNTPISGLQYTQSQMLMSRLPSKQSLLQPKVVQVHDDRTRRQQRQKLYYNKRASPLQKLSPGDVVRVQRERCGTRQSSEALTLTLARIWSRVSTDNSDETENLSETNELPPLFLPAVETASVDHPLTTPCVDARQLREVPAAPPEPGDT